MVESGLGFKQTFFVTGILFLKGSGPRGVKVLGFETYSVVLSTDGKENK